LLVREEPEMALKFGVKVPVDGTIGIVTLCIGREQGIALALATIS